MNNIMKKEEERVLMVAQEIHFAKALAANDKQLRERALRRLNKWLSLKAKSSLEFTEEGFMRIWKGLFYCVWMSDKPLIQESTVESIAQLLHCFVKFQDSLMFMRCFYQAMSQAWFGLDQHRLDKYMMLARRFVRQSFAILKKSDWNEENLKDTSEMFFKALSVAPVGFIMHLADVYLVELSKIGEGKLESRIVVDLVKPWAKLLAVQTDMRIISAVKRHVFLYLIRQTDLAIKHSAKFQSWKNQGFPGGDIDMMEEVEMDSESEMSAGEQDEDDIDEDEVFLDPRAGRADTVLPPVDFQPSDIVRLLSSTKTDQQRTLAARQSKSISSLIEKFKQLEQEKYPLGLKRVDRCYLEDDSSEDEIDRAVERLASFQRETYESSGSKKRKASSFSDLGSTVWDVTETKKETKGIDLILSPHSLASSPWTVGEIMENGGSEGGANVKCKKRKLSGGGVNGIQTPRSSGSAISLKQKTSQNLVVESTPTTSHMNKKISLTNSENGDIVLNISAARQVTPALKLAGKSAGSRKKLKTPGSEKKVLFALSKNRAQEAEEYVKTVEKSPMIPYDAAKKPLQGVLKHSSLASPVDPFYMRKLNQFKKKKSL